MADLYIITMADQALCKNYFARKVITAKNLRLKAKKNEFFDRNRNR